MSHFKEATQSTTSLIREFRTFDKLKDLDRSDKQDYLVQATDDIIMQAEHLLNRSRAIAVFAQNLLNSLGAQHPKA